MAVYDLWKSDSAKRWRQALDRYPEVIAAQEVNRLAELDEWYSDELPGLIAGRDPGYVTLDELSRITEWKMKRGVWRQRNLVLVRGNSEARVRNVTTAGFRRIPDPSGPIKEIAALKGVGPATASAVVAAAAPEIYPFLDDLIAEQVEGLGKVAYTLSYYKRYASALRERAESLGDGWTPTAVERALWANAGGKAGRSAGY